MTTLNIQAIQQDSLIKSLKNYEEIFWFQPEPTPIEQGLKRTSLTLADIQDAEARLTRFAPYLEKVFPELRSTQGKIESEIVSIPTMQHDCSKRFAIEPNGTWWLKKIVIYLFLVQLRRVVESMRYWLMLKSWHLKRV